MIDKEKLIENWDELKDETKKQILALANKEIKEDCFVPKDGEEYYYYGYSYEKDKISFRRQTYYNSNFDIFNIETGTVFRTPEEAVFAGKCDYYTKLFETFVNIHTDKLDWKDDEQPKYYTYYDCDYDCIQFNDNYESNIQGATFASSTQILKDAIAEIGEENFLKYVMKIEI